MSEKLNFLAREGEMNAIIRSYDWTSTPLGNPESWPQSLRTTLSILLGSPQPMLLFWGPENYCFYNDAYQPGLEKAGSHPQLLGKPAATALKFWPSISESVTNVRNGRTANPQNKPFEAYCNEGKTVHWIFDYTPVAAETDSIEGILVTCRETTEQQETEMTFKNGQLELLSLFDQSPVALATIARDQLTFTSTNNFYGSLVGRSPEELIGKPLLEVLPELKGQGFVELLNDVLDSGVPYIMNEVKADLQRNGAIETIYVNLAYQPMRSETGEINSILVVATDVTYQVKSRRKIEQSEERLRGVIAAAPAGVGLFIGRDLIIESPNQTFIDIVGKGPGIVGLPLREAMPELLTEGQPFLKILDDVYTTGEPFLSPASLVKIVQNGVLNDNYYNISYTPLRDSNNEIYGILDIAIDVTTQVKAQMALNESEAMLSLTRDAIPAMIFYMDGEQRYRSYNRVFMEWFNVDETEALGKTTREFIGEIAYANVQPRLARAYNGERVEFEMPAPAAVGSGQWLNIVYTPHFNSDRDVIGVIVHATNITQLKQQELLLRNSEARMRTLIDSAPVAIGLFIGEELIVEMPNQVFIDIVGKGQDIAGKPLAEVMPELAGEGQPFLGILKDVYSKGITFTADAAPTKINRNGELVTEYFNLTFSPLYDADGSIYGILDISVNVTDSVLSRQKLETAENNLRNVIDHAEWGTWSLDIPAMTLENSSRIREWLGITEKNVPAKDVFEIICEEDRDRVRNALMAAANAESAHGFDQEYTVINKLTGRRRIIHALAKVYPNESGELTTISGTAQDITMERNLQLELEQSVKRRTIELENSNISLKRSNSELEQFAYIASHDLQEPIRKISTFVEMLEHSLTDPGEASLYYIKKILTSTDRMTRLIRDVLAYSTIRGENQQFEDVDLNHIMQTVQTDFEVLIAGTSATITMENLPLVKGISNQMVQLFSNLLSNSLKYKHPDVSPVVRISVAIATKEKVARRFALNPENEYYHIQFSDNGIGFREDQAERIFRIFQRLHGKSEFEGTGIGLAICQKIVHNHYGHISAVVGENGGAVFNILLPA